MKKRVTAIALVGCMLLSTGCSKAGPGGNSEEPEVTAPDLENWVAETICVQEAEEGAFTGGVRIEGGYVTGFSGDSDACTVSFPIETDGFYDLKFLLRSSDGGHKDNYILLDGQRIAELSVEGQKFQSVTLQRIYLTAGDHSVTLQKYWGYVDWDKLTVLTSAPFDETVFSVSANLVNPNATDEAKRLMSYLCDCYGNVILSGQFCETGMNGWENRLIAEKNGGLYPAILGLDLGYYSQTGLDNQASSKATDLAIAYGQKNGIVTLCWHWLAPQKYITGDWFRGFYDTDVNMNLTAIVNGEDEAGMKLLKQDIDLIAKELLKLQDAGVPVLWRPLHEASGGWFWWGAEGAETYKKLYILMYDTLTNEYGINNLIWVWNGQHADWYPGDEYVDIVGIDIYAGEKAYGSQINQFLQNIGYCDGNKMVVLSENGSLPDPELCQRDRAMWGFFCTWSGEFVMKDSGKKTYSEQYTDVDMLAKVYQSELVITRDELPDLSTYPIREDSK